MANILIQAATLVSIVFIFYLIGAFIGGILGVICNIAHAHMLKFVVAIIAGYAILHNIIILETCTEFVHEHTILEMAILGLLVSIAGNMIVQSALQLMHPEQYHLAKQAQIERAEQKRIERMKARQLKKQQKSAR